MGAISFTLPRAELNFLRHCALNSEKICGEIVKAGGKTAYENVKANMPSSFRKSNIMHCFKMTKVYSTYYDGAINVKIGFYGYFTNHLGKRTPAPLVANVFEYGSSKFLKRPFFRSSMTGAKVMRAMQEKFKSLVNSSEALDKYYDRYWWDS